MDRQYRYRNRYKNRNRGGETRQKVRKRKRKRGRGLGMLFIISLLAFTAVGVFLAREPKRQMERLKRLEQLHAGQSESDMRDEEFPDWIDVQLIEVDGAARRGETLEAVRDIVIHYVGNPGTSAQQNRDYFDNAGSEVSAHFVVGLEGEVIQCVPLTEKSSASNERNKDTISIEVCHPDETGKFAGDTYDSLVQLTAWLCRVTGLGEKHIIRHYDITGKLCPLYYVEHEEAWSRFLEDVKKKI